MRYRVYRMTGRWEDLPADLNEVPGDCIVRKKATTIGRFLDLKQAFKLSKEFFSLILYYFLDYVRYWESRFHRNSALSEGETEVDEYLDN